MGADTTCDKQEISCSAIVDALTMHRPTHQHVITNDLSNLAEAKLSKTIHTPKLLAHISTSGVK